MRLKGVFDAVAGCHSFFFVLGAEKEEGKGKGGGMFDGRGTGEGPGNLRADST